MQVQTLHEQQKMVLMRRDIKYYVNYASCQKKYGTLTMV